MGSYYFQANEALFAVHGEDYTVGCWADILYTSSGTSIDWAHGEAGIKYTYTIELRDTGNYGFILPADQIIPTGEEIWAFHVSAANDIIEESMG